jgi:hypothetical protein
MGRIVDIYDAFGNLPRWFVTLVIVTLISLVIFTLLNWNLGGVFIIMWVSINLLAINEGYKKVILKKIQQ